MIHPEKLISYRFFSYSYIFLILLLAQLVGDDKKTSRDIQKDIDSRNVELQIMRNEIKDIEERLIRKSKDAIASTEILIDLENKISLMEKLIRSLHREEQYISGIIRDTDSKITKMETRLITLKRQLTQRLQYLYIHGRPGILETILLADDWNSAIYRVKYLDILAEHEKNLRHEIKETLASLGNERVKRVIELKRKTVLLTEKKSEGIQLEKDKKQRRKVLVDIKHDKSILEKNRTKKTQMITEMEQLIKRLYTDKSAMKKREKELARLRAAQNLATTGNFAKMMGKLAWPVEGRIISKFGTIRNPETGTFTENVGIDIQVSNGTKVQSVLDGMVSTITYIRGHGNIIIIDHGGGFSTVYAHIDKISVNENEYIQMGNFIASVAVPENGSSIRLHFEVWGNQKKLNPEKWLASK
jgi:septal ring factor EnvC (AmiA/AmiB activator)